VVFAQGQRKFDHIFRVGRLSFSNFYRTYSVVWHSLSVVRSFFGVGRLSFDNFYRTYSVVWHSLSVVRSFFGVGRLNFDNFHRTYSVTGPIFGVAGLVSTTSIELIPSSALFLA
jgi:hypothetical protein